MKDKKQKDPAPQEEPQEDLQQQLDEMTEVAKRAMADMQNMKRRMEEDSIRIYSRANAELITSLLPAIDNLNRALEHNPDEGLEMAIKQINDILTAAGLIKIETENFDPDLHQALAQGPGEKDKILEVLEDGYMLGEHIIRHTKVKVGNGEE